MALLASHATSRHLAAALLSSGPLWREVHGLCVFLSGKNHSKTFMLGANVTVRPHPAELMSAF